MAIRTVLCTIAAKNYLPAVRCLMATIARHHPSWIRSLVLADRVDGYFDPGAEDFEVIASSELAIPGIDWFHFKYTVLELSTAVKPYALQFLLDRHSADRIIYLDPDIQVYRPLTPVSDMLERHSLVLTPHLTEPVNDDLKPGEMEILQCGAFNLGFCAFAATPVAARILEWWQEKLYDDCVVDLTNSLFVDQRWMDLAPSLFPETGILHHPGCNVAYWNVKQRDLRLQEGEYTAMGEPLYFFHFSGFNPEKPEQFSQHQNRVRLSGLGDAIPLVEEYGRNLLARGYANCKGWPYAYGSFQNGIRIVDIGRKIYREAPALAHHIANPYSDEGYHTFLEYWNEPLLDAAGKQASLTRLAYQVYRGRPDVRSAMPDVWGSDRIRFLQWMADRSQAELEIGDELLAPVQRALEVAKSAQRVERLRAGSLDEGALESFELERPSPHRLPRLAQVIYESRPDLQRTFPDAGGLDRARFLRWLLIFGKEEYRIDESLMTPVRRQWESTVQAHRNVTARMRVRGGYWLLSGAAAARKRVSRWNPTAWRARSPVRAHQTPPKAVDATPQSIAVSTAYDAPPSLGINLIGHLRSEASVGESVRVAAEAARAAGIPTALKNTGSDNPFRQQDFRAGPVSHVFPHPFNSFHINADQFLEVAGSVAHHLFRHRYNIGSWVWELEEFPDRWLDSFRPLHEVWAPSSFCVDAVSRKSPVPVVRIPYAISVPVPDRVSRQGLGLPDGFLFLMLFDMMSCFERKNPLAVVEAFRLAFGNSTACSLAIKVSNGHHRPVLAEKLHRACEGLNAVVIDEVVPRERVNAMIAASDCVVSLHRAEGFGLTLAEAMYLGKPVIATAYSGNLDFTLPGNSFLVGYKMCPVGKDNEPYDPKALWADPFLDAAAAHMQTVASNPELRNPVALAGQEFVREHFSLQAVGARMRQRLEHLLKTRVVAATS